MRNKRRRDECDERRELATAGVGEFTLLKKKERGVVFYQVKNKKTQAAVFQLSLNQLPEPACYAVVQFLLGRAQQGVTKPELEELKKTLISRWKAMGDDAVDVHSLLSEL